MFEERFVFLGFFYSLVRLKKGIIMKHFLLITLLLFSHSVLSANTIRGVITNEHTLFPANNDKPIEFTFSLKDYGKYIFYSKDIVATFTNQTIEINVSNLPKTKDRLIVCSITVFDVPVKINGKENLIKLEEPTVYNSIKVSGC